MKIIYSGLESSGKSLRLAKVTADLVHRNSKWNQARLLDWKAKHDAWTNFVQKIGKRHTVEECNEWVKQNPEPVKPQPRPIVSNIRFQDYFFTYATQEMGVPIVYWNNLDEIIKYDNADIIIDEV